MSLNVNEVLTHMVTDAIVGILHGAANTGYIDTRDLLAAVDVAKRRFIEQCSEKGE